MILIARPAIGTDILVINPPNPFTQLTLELAAAILLFLA